MTPLHPHPRAVIIAAIALALTAITAPTAAAYPPGPTPQSPPQSQIVSLAPAVPRWVPPSQLAAIQRARAQALANHVPPSGRDTGADTNAHATVTQSNPATTSGSGFDWSDAAVGAAIAAAIVVLIAATRLAVRQRRQPRHP